MTYNPFSIEGITVLAFLKMTALAPPVMAVAPVEFTPPPPPAIVVVAAVNPAPVKANPVAAPQVNVLAAGPCGTPPAPGCTVQSREWTVVASAAFPAQRVDCSAGVGHCVVVPIPIGTKVTSIGVQQQPNGLWYRLADGVSYVHESALK